MTKEYIPHYQIHNLHGTRKMESTLPEQLEKLLQELAMDKEIQLTVEARDRIFNLLEEKIDEFELDKTSIENSAREEGYDEGLDAGDERTAKEAVQEAERIQKLFKEQHPDVDFNFYNHFSIV